MKATIIFDERGQIVSISKDVNLKQAGSKFVKVGIAPGRGQRMVHVELSSELQKLRLRDIHKHYHVHHTTSELLKKEPVTAV
jgi:hypothetical protein